MASGEGVQLTNIAVERLKRRGVKVTSDAVHVELEAMSALPVGAVLLPADKPTKVFHPSGDPEDEESVEEPQSRSLGADL